MTHKAPTSYEQKKYKAVRPLIQPAVHRLVGQSPLAQNYALGVTSKDAGVFEMNRSVVKKVAKELKELTVEDLDSALNQGRDIINGESDFYNAIIQLNRQLRDIKMKKIKDMISEDQATTARNKVADSFMDLMDSLEVEDLLKAETETFLRKNGVNLQ